jgi:S-layer protein
VAVTTQGSSSSVTLNNFTSGSTLTLLQPLGTHIVNVNANTATDVLNLVLSNTGDHGSVTANAFETVYIDTTSGPGQDVLDLFDTSLKSLVVTGGDGLTVDTNSTQISSIDASGLGGSLVWAADANTVAITVKTGSGGSDVDFSAMTIPGLAPITFLGGSGNDTVTLGGVGTSRATITTGGGNDEINVGGTDGGNDYSTILDFDVTNNGSIDKLDFGGGVFVATRDQVLEPTATFQDYLDQAANGAGTGAIHWFYWDGDTYVVQDNAAGEDFQDGLDDVIKLEGLLDLTALNFV